MTQPQKTFADICLERAEKATQGPWTALEEHSTIRVELNDEDKREFPTGYNDPIDYRNAEFIAHARTDVPELARRLKKAISGLKKIRGIDISNGVDISFLDKLIDELEKPLETEK